jgi:pimeloyl-ACP methyl ester carboxylesterase
MEHEQIRTNGVRLHVVTAGPVDGPLVVLLHGFPDFWYGFRRQVAFLAERGFRVMAPDQRGYAESDKPASIAAYQIRELTADVLGLIEAAGREKAHVVGHDWGGGVAWMLAVRNPEKVERLAILNAPHPTVMMTTLKGSAEQLLRSWYMFFFQLPRLPEKLLTAGGGRKAFDSIAAEAAPGAFTEADYALYREAWTRPGAATGMVSWYRAMFRNLKSLPRGQDARVRVPALVIWGTGEKYIVRAMADESVALCDDGRLELIEGASHWVKDDAPDRVNALLEGFFRPSW